MSQKVLCEPAPNLRDYGIRRYKKHLALAIVFAGLGAFAFHYTICVPRQNKVREFYSTYDAEAAFERMKDRGLFSSVK